MSEMFSQGEIDRIIEESWKEWEDEKKDDAISRQDAIAFMKKPLSAACAIEYLENAPSVQYISGWIPVSDRLPDNEEMMLVTCRTKKDVSSVNRAYYSRGSWHGSGSMSGVIAWMPMPDPYSGEVEG